MGKSTYDMAALEQALEEMTSVKQDISNASETIGGFLTGIDNRLNVFLYDSITGPMQLSQQYLSNDSQNCDYFNVWLQDTTDQLDNTVQQADDLANNPDLLDIDGGLDGTTSDTVGAPLAEIAGTTAGGLGSTTLDPKSADSKEQVSLDAKEWEKISSKEQDAITKKLKELGFSDKEIEAIKNGDASVDKTKLDDLATKLEKLYKEDPSIREKLKNLYGFDVFNDDGTINKEKLAIAMLIDDKDPTDKYNIQNLLEQLSLGSSKNNKNLNGNSPKMMADAVGSQSKSGTKYSTAIGLGLAAASMAGIGTKYAEDKSKSDSEESEDDENDKSNLADNLKSKLDKIIKGMKPSGSASKNCSNSAIAAAAGLGATGLAGGGILAANKAMMLVFKPEDFIKLPDETKNSIISDFKNVQFTEEEISLFMTSNLKIKASIIDEIINAIKKADELDKNLDVKIKQLYNFSVYENKTISKYLILMIMLIDGKKIDDGYNLYNILNKILAGTENGDYTYQGIHLKDVAVKENNEEQDSKEIQN